MSDLPHMRNHELWTADAECRKVDPETFFPDSAVGRGRVIRAAEEAAKAICRRCPVRELCLAYAIEMREQHGVWGGLTAGELAKIRRARRVLQ